MAKRKRVSEEEEQRREYARLAREERLGERYSSQSKARRSEVVKERTRRAQNLGPAPATDEKAAERIVERDQDRYRKERARRYQAERANRPGGPAQFDPIDVTAPGRSTRVRPLSTMTSGGPAGTADPVKALENDVYTEYVRAGYRMTPAVEDGLAKLEAARSLAGQSVRELGIAQGTEAFKPSRRVLAEGVKEAVSFFLNDYLGSRAGNLIDPSVAKKDWSPWDYAVLGSIPFKPGVKGVEIAAKAAEGVSQGKRAFDAVSDARTAINAARRLNAPASRTLTSRVIDPITGIPGEASVEVGAPRSVLGRTVVAGFDKTREAVSRVPGLPDFQARRVFREIAARERNTSLLERAPASAIKKTANPKRFWLRLTSGQQYALKLVAEGPTVEEHIALRTQLRDAAVTAYDAAKAAGDGAAMKAAQHDAMIQEIHLAGLREAAKYVVPDGTGGLRLADDAPARLKKTWDLMMESGTRREDIVRTLDEAVKGHVEESFADRLQKPGRVVKGARYSDEAGTIVGNEDYAGGKTFVPAVRGIPGTVVDRIRIYATVRSSPGPGAAIGAGPTRSAGANLKKAFTGDSVISGLVRTDAANLSAESLVNASRLSAFKRMRDQLLQIAADVPTHPDDIAIRVDLTKTTDPKLRTATDLLANLENATDESLAVIGEADTQGLLDTMFPRAFEDVDNIKWVSRDAVDATGLLDVRDAALKATSAWKKLGRTAAGLPVDALNDINKAIVLYLNPAYPVVQFLGNSTMSLMQQGVYYPANLAKAWALHWKMNDTARAALDDLIGVSATNAAAEHGTIKKLTNGMADFDSMLADLGPRRAAWLHEARREGYRTVKQVEDLLTNYKGREDVIHKITERGKDAIGNFDRMTPIEKKIITRIFWFYPWTRAAARWSVLHTLEHPYQAAALAYGYDKQQEVADREIGARPWYMHFAVVVGHDKQGRPKVINPTQLFPQTSAIEVPFLIWSFATQQNPKAWPSPIDRFTPALGAAFDAVKDNDASKLLGATADRFQPLNIYNRLSRSPEQVAKDDARKVQPRTANEEILRTFFGSGQVPASVNTKVANRMVAGKKSADQKAQDKVDKLAEETGKKIPDWYVEAEKKRSEVNETAEMVRSRMEEDLGRDLEDGEKDQARVEALAIEAFGEGSPQVAKMVKIARSPYAARNLIRTLEARLGFTRASGYKRVISR